MQITKLRDSSTAVDPFLQRYLEAKAAADRANSNLKVAQRELTDHMAAKRMKSMSVTAEGLKTQVTWVKPEKVDIDEKGLRRKLTAKVFDRYTKKVLDRKAMEEAMETGEIDPVVVAAFVHPVETAPYLRFTQKAADDE